MASINQIANKTYATNAFIYEAKRHGWKTNAIIGVLSYMLAEGLGDMGTFTYESYWLLGPKGPNDYTLGNQYWLNYINGECKYDMRQTSYAGRTDIYAAFGIGLLADTDVFNNDGSKGATNATQLINYCQRHGRPWQDPQAQMNWFFDHSFKQPTVFDEVGVDPTRDNRSADEWCRRITAGYGMPAWHWTDQHDGILKHTARVGEATNAFNAYPNSFQYLSYPGQGGSGGGGSKPDWMPTPDQYIADRLGKAVDMDGFAGAQCWDLWAHFCQTARGPIINCTASGYAKDLWTQRNSNGVLNNFKVVPLNQLQKGDWLIWGEGPETPLSHVGMYVDGSGGRVNVLGQNQNGVPAATKASITTAGLLGAFRPNVWADLGGGGGWDPEPTGRTLELECINGFVISARWV